MGALLPIRDLNRQINAFTDIKAQKALNALFGITRGEDSGAGTSPASTIVPEEYGNDSTIRKTVLTITALTIALSDDAGAAQYGGAKIYDFPLGLIQIIGASVSGNFTGYASLIDTFDGDVAIGTATATTGATLTGTEADIMVSNPTTTAVAEVAAVAAAGYPASVCLNGTTTAKDAYLNFVVDDNAAHGTGNASFTGTVTIYWRNLTAL